MAVESVAGICMDEKIISELAQNPAFILKLVQLLDDQPVYEFKIYLFLTCYYRLSLPHLGRF
jgi:hypothetical protein